jgi:hypothetical protein
VGGGAGRWALGAGLLRGPVAGGGLASAPKSEGGGEGKEGPRAAAAQLPALLRERQRCAGGSQQGRRRAAPARHGLAAWPAAAARAAALTAAAPSPLLSTQVYLAPGDTFRAAAAGQLAEWASRSGATMGPFKEGGRPGKVRGGRGRRGALARMRGGRRQLGTPPGRPPARPSAAAAGWPARHGRRAPPPASSRPAPPPFQVLAQCCKEAAESGDVDVVICDTAGRLHTAYNLMDELKQCKDAIRRWAGRAEKGRAASKGCCSCWRPAAGLAACPQACWQAGPCHVRGARAAPTAAGA